MVKNRTENPHLYPERQSSDLDQQLEELKKIENGETECIELDEEEKKEALEFEDRLGQLLEQIDKMNAHSLTIGVDYFLDEGGREDFENTFGITIAGTSKEEIVKFIQSNRDLIEKTGVKKRELFAGRADKFSDEKLEREMLQRVNAKGELNIDGVEIPTRTSFMLGPKDALEKIKNIREFKANLQKLEKKEPGDTNASKARQVIMDTYHRRINTILAGNYFVPAAIMETAKALGESALSQEEKELLKCYSGACRPELMLSRIDKLLFGSGTESDEFGNFKQIGPELIKFADKLEKESLDNNINRDEKIKALGLDPEKIFRASIEEDEFKKFAEEALSHYELLSSLPQEDYDRERKEPAPDNKWQIIISPDYKAMSVDGAQKIVKSGNKPKNIYQVLAVLIAHEIEGHVLQNENRSRLPLRIFKRLGTDRGEIYGEGGAMENQDEASQAIFGFKSLPHSHYIRAIIKRMEGGNYLECAQAFFDSAIKEARIKKEHGLIDEEEFKKEIQKNLALAINRSQRPFRPFISLDSTAPLVTNSSSAMYLEQKILLEKLKKTGNKKYAFIGGLNLKTLAQLARVGLIKISEIKEPEQYAEQIWQRIKENYKL